MPTQLAKFSGTAFHFYLNSERILKFDNLWLGRSDIVVSYSTLSPVSTGMGGALKMMEWKMQEWKIRERKRMENRRNRK